VPHRRDLLAKHIGNDMDAVVIAVAAGKNEDAEMHFFFTHPQAKTINDIKRGRRAASTARVHRGSSETARCASNEAVLLPRAAAPSL
jgi:hypothetical protein